MANIERKNQKIFAKNSPKLGQFGSAIANTRVVSGDIEVLQELPAYEEGWDKAIITKKNYPTWQEMDGIQYGLSYQIAYLLQHGIPEWNNKQEYSLHSFCSKGGKIWKSLIPTNIGNDPEQESSSTWEEFGTPKEILDGKLNTDIQSNVTKEGKTYISELNAPSSKFIRIPASSTEYITPADGYIAISAQGAAGQPNSVFRAYWSEPNLGIEIHPVYGQYNDEAHMRVRKGAKILFSKTRNPANIVISFFYTEGSQP